MKRKHRVVVEVAGAANITQRDAVWAVQEMLRHAPPKVQRRGGPRMIVPVFGVKHFDKVVKGIAKTLKGLENGQ